MAGHCRFKLSRLVCRIPLEAPSVGENALREMRGGGNSSAPAPPGKGYVGVNALSYLQLSLLRP
eukprot:493422-Pyramimonas_sp.AAC.1